MAQPSWKDRKKITKPTLVAEGQYFIASNFPGEVISTIHSNLILQPSVTWEKQQIAHGLKI
jgi:hypothetical protein